MNLRVVHITPALFGDGGAFGGAERYTFELARHMATTTPTTLVSFGPHARRYTTREGLRVRVLGPAWYVRGNRFNPVHPGLIRAVAGATVVHCHQTYLLASEFAAVLARATGRRVFTTDLGGGGWCLAARVRTANWFHEHLHLSRYSEAVAGHAGNPRSRVIYGGVDTETFSPDPAVPKEPVVAYVGRLLPHKGIDDLVAALPDGLTLELVGRATHPQYFADLKRLAAGKRVVFRLDSDDAEVVRAYRRAVAVVLPSVYRTRYGAESRVPELLGQTLLEGMACGTPAVCTDVASMPEVVAQGATGFVVPANSPAALREKLEWLRDHPHEAGRMGAAGRQRVLEHFTWPQTVARCLAAYRGRPSPVRESA